MPRYLPPNSTPSTESLPLDTIVTVLPRQSKKAGARLNVHSQELADHELISLATAHGYTPEQVRIDKRDMGISANTTTINDRPALSNWLRNLLPEGISKVVIFSQEDRAFRDEEEVELNLFIREVKRYRGWVICGHKVYRLWEEYDADMFRMECKYAAKYIVHQVRGRLLPSVTRAAQRGLYDGRGINVGYVVDYNPLSPTYKRFIPYRPHADLVLHEIFERFAKLPYPSVPALVRAWNASNGMEPVYDEVVGRTRQIPTLFFPTLPSDIDPRVMRRQSWGRPRTYPPYGIDDPLRRGWLLREQGARGILSNVFYIGWVIRDQQIVRGETLENGQARVDPKGSPLVLHEPIVPDLDLFWYCFERVSAYTIDGQPNPKRRFYTKGPRRNNNQNVEPWVFQPWPRAIRNAETNTLLLLGKVRCGIHGPRLCRSRRRSHEPDCYICKAYDEALGSRQNTCVRIPGKDVDRAVVQEFLARLQLTEADIQGIARAWQAQQRLSHTNVVSPQGMSRAQTIESELANLALGVARTSVESVRVRLVAEMEKLTKELERIRAQVHERQEVEAQTQTEPLSLSALQVAQKSAKALEALRLNWDNASLASRQALMQWVVDSVTIAPVADDRKGLVGSIVWRGGVESHFRMTRSHARRQVWDAREQEVMHLWYPIARWEDLKMLLPERTRGAMGLTANRWKLPSRSKHSSDWQAIPVEEKARLAPLSMPVPYTTDHRFDGEVKRSTLSGTLLLEISNAAL